MTDMILEVALPIPLFKNFDYLLSEEMEFADSSELIGRRVRVPFGFKSSIGIIAQVKNKSDTSPDRLKKVWEVIDTEPILDSSLLALGGWLSHRYLCSLGEALFSLLPPGKHHRDAFPEEHKSDVHDSSPVAGSSGFHLTEHQKSAMASLHESIFSPTPQQFFLSGVAAAGKTEVYLSAIKEVINQGKTVLYLAPEIGLAVQSAEILKHRFGESSVCIWHSDQSPRLRAENWWRIKRSEFSIVVGTRSAVLVPLGNMGIVIIDEEQDPAFKEERKPRFHAREVARERAKICSATFVMGSAVPSMETELAIREGDITRLSLPSRAVSAATPHIQLIDMKKEKMRGALSPSLEKALAECLQAKQQTILFLNRRGFYRAVRCSDCSWVAHCPQCSVVLVHHKTGGAGRPMRTRNKKQPLSGELHCHLCNHVSPLPTHCPDCRSLKVKATGFGTQRVAEEVQEKFPWAKVLRWDRDTAAKKGEHEKFFKQFSAGEFDVLVGTQVVAQGFHFPNVNLVGVVDADVPLHIPDFRAAERTFQLLTQVAGRAGRELVTGDVLIQTRNPEHYALVFASKMDAEGFAETELKYRHELNYPPFTHLILIRAHEKTPEKTDQEMNRFLSWLGAMDPETTIGVLGPTKSRASGRGGGGIQLLLKIPEAEQRGFLLNLHSFLSEKPVRLWIDVDPEYLS